MVKKGAYSYKKFFEKHLLLWKFCFLVLFIALLLAFSWNEYSPKIKKFKKASAYNIELYDFLQWIKYNAGENDVVLAHWEFAPFVYGIANKNVIVTSKVYPSESSVVAERYKDLSKFFFSQNENIALEVVRKYNVTHIAIPKNFNLKVCWYTGGCNAVRRRDNNTLIFRFLDNSNLKYFEQVYGSQNFKMYRVLPYFPDEAADKWGAYTDYARNSTISYLESKSIAKRDYNVVGSILPHDIFHAGTIIIENIGSIKGDFDRIILLGPDHFSRASHPITTSDNDFQGFFGAVQLDLDSMEKLGAPFDNQIHNSEHSIRILVPYINYFYPSAKIVPVLFRHDVSYEEARNFGEKLSAIIDDKTLVIASIDFSHIIPANPGLAELEDKRSLEALSNFKKQDVYSLVTEGRPALVAFLTAMEKRNALKVHLLNMSSQSYPKGETTQTVGYISLHYSK